MVGSEGAALQFGDWLTKLHPSCQTWDLCQRCGRRWRERTLDVAEDFYWRWLESTPSESLRLKPTVEVDPVHMRLGQRGISMLLGILPEALRRDIVGARNVSTVSILYRPFVVFQPGSGAERASLLTSLTCRGSGGHYFIMCLVPSALMPLDSDAGAREDVGCSWKAWRISSLVQAGVSATGASG